MRKHLWDSHYIAIADIIKEISFIPHGMTRSFIPKELLIYKLVKLFNEEDHEFDKNEFIAYISKNINK